MLFDPGLDCLTPPNATSRKRGLGLWEISVGVSKLINPLARDAQDLRDFRSANQVIRHSRSLYSLT